MRRRIRIGIPDGILNDYLKGMTNERAAYEIIRLATNSLHGISNHGVPAGAGSQSEAQTATDKKAISNRSSTEDSNSKSTSPAIKDVSFADDLQMLS